MALHDPSDIAARGDALVCRSAVLLLRACRRAGVAGEDWAPDVDRLPSAVGLALETTAGSIQTTLRSAVVQLAEHLVQRPRFPSRPTPSAAMSRSSTHGPPVASPPRLAGRW
jgi:hypothetical protein